MMPIYRRLSLARRTPFAIIPLLSTDPVMALVQRGGDAAGAAACAGCGMALLLIPLIFIALNIVLLVWVARDARARGMDTPVLWMIVVLMTSVMGLIVYLLARPAGNLVPCPHCNNRRLEASAVCPTCGNPWGSPNRELIPRAF